MSKRVTSRDQSEKSEERGHPKTVIIDSVKVLLLDEGKKNHIITYHEGGDKKMLESQDPAADSFYRTLQALAPDAIDILEYPEDFEPDITVKGIRIKYEGSQLTRKVSIGIHRKLHGSIGGYPVSTPYKYLGSPETSETDGEPTANEGAEFTVHTTYCALRLKSMIEHTENYVLGKRADMTLMDQE